ncbi:TPA: serine racemase VanT catalytic subunit [Streptococcus pneumoniae]|uniref:serine racemase VanT catalytic subunit n=1 Tax=Streptococcus pneumoniae TaxID=1313 RepID=UPI00351950D5
MTKNESYSGIDYFRFIAALLIVAIHTSPLSSFSETGNFIFTRIVSRVAVPFFFMTSGFFLISRYTCNAEKLEAFIKKTTLIYGVAILLYIPINVYNGYFKMDNLLPNIIKDIVFDGTLYHLWYLPASIIGAAIAWYLVKKLNYPKALMVASVLYLIGLFGDSYYGITEKISCLNSLYTYIFQVTDYTRNGIFFAPIFFILGGFIADNRPQITFGKSFLGFAISLALMLGEAMILHHFDLQRHDSMYVFLLPCMYFLFIVILHFKGKRLVSLRTASLIIYIIHPMMIVVIRLFSKLLHIQKLFVENSIVHYFAVCLTSVVFSVVLTAMWNKYKPKKAKHTADTDRAYLEIDLNNLEHNVKVLKRAMPQKCELMAVVKAEAYGHGLYEIATHLNKIGVKAFAVATIDEGIKLRQYGVLGEILILGYTAPARAKELRKYDLTQTLIDYKYALLLDKQGYNVMTHIKVDTGMHRLGFDAKDIEKISAVFSMKHIKVSGIYTHLCAADSIDEKDIFFTNVQIESFYNLLNQLKEKGITIPKIHIQSSYGLLNYPELKCDYVRVGVSLYGVLSSPNDRTKLHLDLRPVLSLKSRVILLREIKKGESVGYSRSFVANRDSLIALLPVGYADGYPRNLSCGKSYVLINGHQAPVVGKICMDQLAVDVTDIPNVKTGSIATLIGKDGKEEITAPMVAESAESITNELLSRMGHRLNIIRRA